MLFLPWKWPSSSPPPPELSLCLSPGSFCLSNSSQCPGRILFVASFLNLLYVHAEKPSHGEHRSVVRDGEPRTTPTGCN